MWFGLSRGCFERGNYGVYFNVSGGASLSERFAAAAAIVDAELFKHSNRGWYLKSDFSDGLCSCGHNDLLEAKDKGCGRSPQRLWSLRGFFYVQGVFIRACNFSRCAHSLLSTLLDQLTRLRGRAPGTIQWNRWQLRG
jgi:hypothetical protein